MAKNFVVQFGQTFYSGLSPTFTLFKVVPGGGSTTPPGITEIPTTTGLYYFSYEPAATIAFTIDGATTGLVGAARYVVGSIDPIDAVDERITEMGSTLAAIGASATARGATLVAMGTSLAAMGSVGASLSTLVGTLGDSFGSTLTDPSTVMGYLKRLQEFNEGDAVFTKSSGAWDIYARSSTHILGATTYPGTTTMLREKVIADSGSVISKT